MKLIPLGTNGFFPSLGRETMSFLVLTEDEAILLDAGTGVGRLIEPEIAKLVRGYDRLNIFLSHYHLDHCAGLAYLPGVWKGTRVVIHGPAPPFAKTTPDEALGRLLDVPFSAPLEAFPFDVEVVPVSTPSMTLGGSAMSFRGQKHWNGSMGIRIGNDITYVTDTVVDDGTVDLAKGVKLLLHEVWMTDDEFRADKFGATQHSYVSGVARIAKAADVGRLMITHHQPKRVAAEVADMARGIEKLAEREVMVPEESRCYEI
jgi:ribonuclease BN (tRNA processing enzyme)